MKHPLLLLALCAIYFSWLPTNAQTGEGRMVANLAYTELEGPTPKIKILLKYYNHTGAVREIVQMRWAFYYNPDVLELIPSETGSLLKNIANEGLNDPEALSLSEHGKDVVFNDMSPDLVNPLFTGKMPVLPGIVPQVSKNFVLMEYQRSTSICDHMIVVPGHSEVDVYKVSFWLKPGVDPDSYLLRGAHSGFGKPEFIMDYIEQAKASNSWPAPVNAFKEINFIKYDDLDKLRPRKHTGNCEAGGNITGAASLVMGKNDFTIEAPVLLPIQLQEFVGQRSGNSINLYWTVANPGDYSGFKVQKLTGNGLFSDMAYVVSDVNANRFQYQDMTPIAGINYYRLQLLSKAGSIHYSQVVAIANHVTVNQLLVQSLGGGRARITVFANEAWTISASSSVGQRIIQRSGTGNQTFEMTFPIGGLYIINMLLPEKGSRELQKVLVTQ